MEKDKMMKKNVRNLVIFICTVVLGLTLIVLAGCSSSTSVDRVNDTKKTDYSGYWNDTDVRLVAKDIIKDFNNSKAIKQYPKTHGKQVPCVIIGSYKNASDEHIDTRILTDYLQAELLEDENVKFVAQKSDRAEVREEREDQQENAREETRARLKAETGADYMMQGSIRTIVESTDDGKKTARTYYVVTELIDIETTEILWKNDNHEIKKIIKRKSRRR
ncbi:MAG: penicillin-binding protein activator LpoB [Treponema sp.]|nr:penicillin-binding protein activator LpoB [Treponema sp.]